MTGPMIVDGKLIHAGTISDPDLTRSSIRLSSTIVCAKCKRDGLLHRHHKGHEKLLAYMFPEKWEQRYSEFREEDIVRICEDCHYEITALHSMVVYGTMNKEMEWTWPTIEEAEALRKELAKLTNWWLRHG